MAHLTLESAVADLAAAGRELRPNAVLDEFFGAAAGPAPIGRAAEPLPELRPNDLLDAVFGGRNDAPIPLADGPPSRSRDQGVYGLAGQPAADAPIPLAEGMPRREKVGDQGAYAVLPPTPLPGKPNTPFTGTGPVSGVSGINPADLNRWIREIRDGVLKLVERAGKGGGPGTPTTGPGLPPPPAPGDPGYTWGDAGRPVTDWLKGTRVGRIGSRLAHRLRPAVKAMRSGRATRAAKGKPGPKGLPGGGLPKGVKPPVPPVPAGGGAAAAEGAAAGGTLAAGSAVPVVGAAIAATAALIELARAGKDLAYQQEGRARELSQYSVAQAGQLAQLDYHRVEREMASGSATAQTSGELTDSIDRFEKSARAMTDAIDNVSNVVGSRVLDLLSLLADLVAPLAEGVSELVKLMPGYSPEPRDELFGDQLARIDRDIQRSRAGLRNAADAARDAMNRGRWPPT